MYRLCVLVLLTLAIIAGLANAQQSGTEVERARKMKADDTEEKIRQRIHWFRSEPWSATDERGEGILLRHAKFAPRGPLGFIQYFTFHDERPLRVVFVFDGDRVRISQERDTIGANWCLCGRLPIQSELNKTSWRFDFRPIVEVDGSPHLLRIELVFEDDDHFTETIGWIERGSVKTQSLHFVRNNAGPGQARDTDVATSSSK